MVNDSIFLVISVGRVRKLTIIKVTQGVRYHYRSLNWLPSFYAENLGVFPCLYILSISILLLIVIDLNIILNVTFVTLLSWSSNHYFVPCCFSLGIIGLCTLILNENLLIFGLDLSFFDYCLLSLNIRLFFFIKSQKKVCCLPYNHLIEEL